MITPDLELYHIRKHQLIELIDKKRQDEKTIQQARDANSQLMALESFMTQQINAIINLGINQSYHIQEILKSTTESIE